jgi:hypothetical protein
MSYNTLSGAIRVTQAQREAITASIGLYVYQTDGTRGYYQFTTENWVLVSGDIVLTTTGTSGASTLVGNTLNIPSYAGGVNIGNSDLSLAGVRTLTLNNQNLTFLGSTTSTIFYSNGNVNIGGTSNLGFKLDVNGTTIFRNTLTMLQDKSITSSNGGITITFGSTGLFDGSWSYQLGTTKGVVFSNAYNVLSSASALVEINSTSRGFLPSRMTTAQINLIVTPAVGLIVYNTTLNALCIYTGTTTLWRQMTTTAM